MTVDDSTRNSGRLHATAFVTSTLVFLMLSGAGIAMMPVRLFEFVERGEVSAATAWSVSVGGVLVGLFLAIFVAHIAISFLELATKDTVRRSSSPSDPAPPRPKKRSLRLVA
jgi:heme/copper-type cytochrome/quinol oxidase subunit 1